jgi:hypothetical protein
MRYQGKPAVNESRDMFRLQGQEPVRKDEHHLFVVLSLLQTACGVLAKDAREKPEESSLVEVLTPHHLVMVENQD